MKKTMAAIVAGLIVAGGLWAADEISMMGYLKAEKGARKIERSPGTITINWQGSRYYSQIYSLTTNNWQAMAKGAVGTNGIFYCRNVGTNGNVKVSFDVGVTSHLLLKSGEFYTMRLDPAFEITNIMFLVIQPSTNVITEDFEATILED